MTIIEVLNTSITTLQVDAITNAANTDLQLLGGVAGAIRDAGGPEIQVECDKKKPIALGDAVATGGGQMPCQWVIHAATMELSNATTTADIVRRCTDSSLQCAEQLGAKSLAFTAFGTGVARFPKDQAAQIEVEEVRTHLAQSSTLERIVFADIDPEMFNEFHKAMCKTFPDAVVEPPTA